MSSAQPGKRAAPEKSERAFRTISEVSEELSVPQHVLRFWETRFTQVRPIKRNGGRRLYRPDHVALLRGIRALLYDDALTIRGVQKVLRERGQRAVIARGAGDAGLGIQEARGEEASERLAAIRDRLETAERDAPELPFAEAKEGPAEDAPPADAPAAAPDEPPEAEAEAERDAGGEAARPAPDPATLSETDRARLRASIARLEDILSRLEN